MLVRYRPFILLEIQEQTLKNSNFSYFKIRYITSQKKFKHYTIV